MIHHGSRHMVMSVPRGIFHGRDLIELGGATLW